MKMDNLRKYGQGPFRIAVIHGGPGAPGSAALVARTLALKHNILEPLQTADSVVGQAKELHDVLRDNSLLPITLIGLSWGAMLSFIVAARYPYLVKKLIMVGSGPYEAAYAKNIQKTRLSRLNEQEKVEAQNLIAGLNSAPNTDHDRILEQLGRLFDKSDNYNPLYLENEAITVDYNQHLKVWAEAEALRASGEMLNLGTEIKCPVIAIHGDYDPHPAEGVKKPLSRVLSDFRFIVLKNCGHTPWVEKEARDEFYQILDEELSDSTEGGMRNENGQCSCHPGDK
jgi:pimeloyl-ACP methyl ester carboxylesterase